MSDQLPKLRLTFEFPLSPMPTFDLFIDELMLGLARRGIRFDPRKEGRITEDAKDVGCVTSFIPGDRLVLDWKQPDWAVAGSSTIEARFETRGRGTQVIIEQSNPASFLGENGPELLGWFASQMVAPFLQAVTSKKLGDWLTDRRARHPTGSMARETYENPIYHQPNFRAILAELQLSEDDYLLEVGCGGGAFLHDALDSGCRAAAIDHSMEMLRLASRVNEAAIRDKKLRLLESEADKLPFENSTFTCAVMTGVFGFLPDPVKALSEVHRTLKPGGRFVMFTSSKELKGTPAAPEPMASRLNFYEDEDLVRMARDAGFSKARVERPDLRRYAEESKVPREALSLFSAPQGQLLIASRAG